MTKARITDTQLDNVCKRISKALGYAEEPFYKGTDGQYHPNPHNYHIDSAYGGVSLVKFGNEGTGTYDVLACGHVPKRELFSLLLAFEQGLTEGKRK